MSRLMRMKAMNYDSWLSVYRNIPVTGLHVSALWVIGWARAWQNQQNDQCPQQRLGSGHPPSLIRVVAVRMKKSWVLSYPLSTQRRLWSNWADTQADLSPRWVHWTFCWCCHAVAQGDKPEKQTWWVFEPRHHKTNKMSVCPAKTQISLGICPVWSIFAVRLMGT